MLNGTDNMSSDAQSHLIDFNFISTIDGGILNKGLT